jgi:hypothetical protein
MSSFSVSRLGALPYLLLLLELLLECFPTKTPLKNLTKL